MNKKITVFEYEDLLMRTMSIVEFELAILHMAEKYHVVVIYPQTFGREKFKALIEFMDESYKSFIKKLDAYKTSEAAKNVLEGIQDEFKIIIKDFYKVNQKDEILPYHTLLNLIIGIISRSYEDNMFYFPFIFTEKLMGLEMDNFVNTDYINAYGFLSNTYLDIHMTQLKNPVITKKGSNLVLNRMTQNDIFNELDLILNDKDQIFIQNLIKLIDKLLLDKVFMFICFSIGEKNYSNGIKLFLQAYTMVKTKYGIKSSTVL